MLASFKLYIIVSSSSRVYVERYLCPDFTHITLLARSPRKGVLAALRSGDMPSGGGSVFKVLCGYKYTGAAKLRCNFYKVLGVLYSGYREALFIQVICAQKISSGQYPLEIDMPPVFRPAAGPWLLKGFAEGSRNPDGLILVEPLEHPPGTILFRHAVALEGAQNRLKGFSGVFMEGGA